jgi:hypothetical protein
MAVISPMPAATTAIRPAGDCSTARTACAGVLRDGGGPGSSGGVTV